MKEGKERLKDKTTKLKSEKYIEWQKPIKKKINQCIIYNFYK